MTTLWDRVTRLLDAVGWAPGRIAAVEPDDPSLPAAWRRAAGADTPSQRCAAAYGLWNAAFVAQVPTFWAGLHQVVTDVAPLLVDGRHALVYAGVRPDGSVAAWLGRDPRDPMCPQWWEDVPEALRAFLGEVHGGFTAADGVSCGPLPPAAMQTIDAIAGLPGEDVLNGADGWNGIAPARLLQIASNGMLAYCVSPDLPLDELALVYEGDVDPMPFAPALDELMASYVDAD